MKKYLKDLVPLVAICLVAALLLAIFNMITEGPIAENTRRAAEETRARLLAAASTFEAVELEEGSAMDSCYQGFDANGESVGYVVATTVGGYGGEIVVTVGMDTDNVITCISVGGENFSETAGLGALAKEPAFTDQFIGETVPLTLAKGTTGTQDGIIDALAGATITSTAVNGGVNSAGKFVMDMAGGGASPNTASVQGFAGPVAVTLSLDDAGAITEITIGDAFFNETEGYGKKALEEAFQAQFVGKVPPLTLADIDAISGATITSTAVVNAVNQVQAQLSGAAPVAAPVEEEAIEVPAAGENAKTASAQGFAGAVAVAVDLDENNTITAITIGDDAFAETPGFGAKALEDTFKAQFIGKTLPVAAADVDGIAGATITTNAVIDALNSIVAPAAEVEEAAADTTAAATAGATPEKAEEAVPAVAEVPAELRAEREVKKAEAADTTAAATADANAGATAEKTEAAAPAVPAELRAEREVKKAEAASSAAVLKGSAKGFAGAVAVEITVENNAITAITIGDDAFAETPGFGAKALEDTFQSQFIGKTLPVADVDIDAIAGATVTTNAVIEAINTAK